MSSANSLTRAPSPEPVAGADSAAALIRLTGVRKLYRTHELETTALADVSLDIKQGEFVAVMGPSGCGKSTLLNIVAMIDTPSSGSYFLGDIEVSSYPESKLVNIRKHNIGFIFQSFNLIDDLSVYENVELPLLYQDVPKKIRKSRVREVLELVDLLPVRNTSPRNSREVSSNASQSRALSSAIRS